MQWNKLTRPRVLIPAILVTLLIALFSIVFHPAFQQRMVLKYAAPQLESLALDYIHLTPWSLTVKGLQAGFQGGDYHLQHATARFCLSKLFFRQLHVEKLQLAQLQLDLTKLQTTPPTDETNSVFQGIFSTLAQGYGYRIDDLQLDAQVLLPAEQRISFTLKGGQIAPQQTGELAADIRFDTGKQEDHILINSRWQLAQLSKGVFDYLQGHTDIQLALAALPATESLTIQSRLDSEEIAVSQQTETAIKTEEQIRDVFQITVTSVTDAATERATLALAGHYDGSTGMVGGNYQLNASQHLLQPYLPNQQLPPARQQITGDFSYLLPRNIGDISLSSDLELDKLQQHTGDAKVPQLLRLKNDFRISLLPNRQLSITTLQAVVEDDSDRQSLTAHNPSTLQVPLDNVGALLQQDHVLLELEIPALPLAWFDFLLPEHEIERGNLTAAFQIATDAESALHITPLRPVTVEHLSIRQGDQLLADDISLTMAPSIIYRDASLDISLQQLHIAAASRPILQGSTTSHIQLGDEQTATDVSASVQLNTQNTLQLIKSANRPPKGIPTQFQLDVGASFTQGTQNLLVQSANISLGTAKRQSLLDATLLQPITLDTQSPSLQINSANGELARLQLADIQLGWIAAFLPMLEMEGQLKKAQFTLRTDQLRNTTFSAQQALALENVSIRDQSDWLLRDIQLSLWPTIQFSPDHITIDYKELQVQSGGKSILAANGRIQAANGNTGNLSTNGQLTADLQSLSRQPLVNRILKGTITSPVSMKGKYNVDRTDTVLRISELLATLHYANEQARITLRSDTDVVIGLQADQQAKHLQQRARGTIQLSLNELTAEPFSEILQANQLDFSSISGKLILTSAQDHYDIRVTEPLTLTDLEIGSAEKTLLHPFTLTTGGTFRSTGDAMQISLQDLAINSNSPHKGMPLRTNLSASLTSAKDGSLQLKQFTAKGESRLPALLDQPALLPKHQLTDGNASFDITLSADQRASIATRMTNLTGKKALPLETLSLQLEGQWNPNGNVQLQGPIRTQGKSGQSDLDIELQTSAWQDAPRQLQLNLSSSFFYLNDILNTLQGIRGNVVSKSKTPEPQKTQENSQEANDRVADSTPFWDVLPYESHVSLHIEQLYYTDYLIIDRIQGTATIAPDEISLRQFSAYFHDSPLKMNTQMTFTPGEAPYHLSLDAGISQFDLATFLRELVPDAKPRAEGLFDIALTASGDSPNLAQYRNELLFDMQLNSTEGVFRLLDPNSALVGGTTGLLGTLGEGISYIPTGLFGVGAVSRLVKYIKEVDYETINVHLSRDTSRDIRIEKYLVRNPELLMTAQGGVMYLPGTDVLQSPLNMQAQLNFRGHGAAIMYDLNLLEDQRDEEGYWIGPTVSFTGTPANSASNLDEIISKAGNAAVLGGVTRPISGLIGNIKHRWFGGEDKKKTESDSP